jgi:hypothetical protein
MAIFPECAFSVRLARGLMTSGSRIDGILELEAPEAIPRAEHVDLFFRSRAWAGYGSGKSRSVIERDIFAAALKHDLPVGQPLPAGTHQYPFTFDLPPWVPPSFPGNDCGIVNTIEARLDVAWAKDPKAEIPAVVRLPPASAVASPYVMRSPLSFHKSIVLEVTLDSSVGVQGHPFTGRVALRGGHDARFDGVEISLWSVARIAMHRGDARTSPASPKARIPADALRRGEPVPFVVVPFDVTPCSFPSRFIEHGLHLEVSVDVPWTRDPAFAIPVVLLPPGTITHPNPTALPVAVGSERLQLLAAYMAQASGLSPGVLPSLVEGRVGLVDVRISDSPPRAGRLGIDVDLVFPDLELGVACRSRGLLDGRSPLVPEPLREEYVVRFQPSDRRPPLDETVLSRLTLGVLDALDGVEEVRFSDHYLGYHVPLANDGSEYLQAIARLVCAKANAIGAAIAALPFPSAAQPHAAAWLATAAEQSAALVPCGPSLHGLTFRTRILGGEERVVVARLRTAWREDGPVTVVDLDLRAAPLPPAAMAAVNGAPGEGGLTAVREVFPVVSAMGLEHVVLERPGLAPDPRSLFIGIEGFASWLLDARGERRADAPYR